MHPVVNDYLNGAVPIPPNPADKYQGNTIRKLKNEKVDKNGNPVQMRSVSETKSAQKNNG